jgi:hypothetical protein
LKIGYVGSAMQDVTPEFKLKFEDKNPDILFDFLKEIDNSKADIEDP